MAKRFGVSTSSNSVQLTCCAKSSLFVILSEAKNLSGFRAQKKKERFFASLRMTNLITFPQAVK